jgi:hypothetical protein
MASRSSLTTPLGYQKPRLPLSSASQSAARLSIHFRLFCSILTSTLLGFSLPLVLPQATSFDTIYLAGYSSFLLTIWTILSGRGLISNIVTFLCCFTSLADSHAGQLLFPVAIDVVRLFSFERTRFNRSHVCHMRIDRLRRLPGYRDPRADCYSLYELFTVPASFLFRLVNSARTFGASCTASSIPPNVSRPGFYSGDVQTVLASMLVLRLLVQS